MKSFLKLAGVMAIIAGVMVNTEGMNEGQESQDPNLGSVVLNLVDEIQANFELFKGTGKPRELYKIRLNENKLDKDGCPELEYLDSEIDDADMLQIDLIGHPGALIVDLSNLDLDFDSPHSVIDKITFVLQWASLKVTSQLWFSLDMKPSGWLSSTLGSEYFVQLNEEACYDYVNAFALAQVRSATTSLYQKRFPNDWFCKLPGVKFELTGDPTEEMLIDHYDGC